MKRSAYILMVSVILAGCSARVDTSTPDNYRSSVNAITKDMSPEKKKEFQEALVAVSFDTADPSTTLFAGADPASPIFIGAADKIKGKTADDIIKLGYTTRIAKLELGITEDVSAIHRINAEREKYKNTVESIHIDAPKYRISKSMFSQQPIISFRITNNSKIVVKRIYAHGILSSPGRTIPWVSDDFNYEFTGGLEPGESKNLDLEPNMFGEWRYNNDYSNKTDLKLEISLMNLEDASGEKLLKGDPGDAKAKEVDAAEKQKMKSELEKRLSK